MTVTIETAPAPERLQAWDDVVQNSPGSDVSQLSGWARVRALAGFQAMYAFVEAGGDLVGGSQILVRRIPVLGAVGYVPYGPVIAASAARPAAVRGLLAAALDAVGRSSVRLLFVQPPEGDDDTSAALLGRGFRPSDANIAPSASLRIDLTADEEQLRRNLSRRLRGWTKQWATRGVTVREGGEADFVTAAELHARTAEHHGFRPFTDQYLAAMHRELASGGHFLLLIGEVHGRPGVMGVYTGSGGVLKSRLVGLDRSSEASRHDTVAAVDWAALTWAKRNGYRWFDFSGISPASAIALEADGPTDHAPLPGPDRYKLRFGGEIYRYPQPVELIPSPVIRLGYDLSRRSRAGRDLLTRGRRWARAGSVRGTGHGHSVSHVDHSAVRPAGEKAGTAPRRILQVGPDPAGIGGIESVIRNYLDLLSEPCSAEGDGILTSSVPTWRSHRSVLGNLASMLSAGVLLAREWARPGESIVHVHLSHGGSFIREGALVMLSRALGMSTCATVHGSSFVESAQRPGWAAVYRLPLRAAHTVAVLDRPAAAVVSRLAGPTKVQIVCNPGPVPRALAYRAPEERRAVVFAGQRSRRKGLDVLIAAWPTVTHRIPGARLLLAGPPYDVDVPQTEGIVDLGAIDAPAVLAVLQRAAVAVLPSRHEAMPVFVIEALAAGRPVVVTTVGAMPDMVGAAGVTVPPEDPAALADRLVGLLSEETPHELLGQAAGAIYTRTALLGGPALTAALPVRDRGGEVIPRIIHQIWLGGAPPAEVAGWLETWDAHHPGWEHRVWDDGNLPVLQNQSLFDAAPSYAMKADILRLEVLLRWGGVYVDADYECHRPIDGLVDGVPLVLLSEGPILTNSFIAATPGHRLIQTLVERLSEVDPLDVATGHAGVLSTSGPKFLTRTLCSCRWMGTAEMRILPPDYFLVPQSREREVQQWAATRRYATHHALKSWSRRTLGSRIRETRVKTRIRRFMDLEAT